jgi:hypothetical protein
MTQESRILRQNCQDLSTDPNFPVLPPAPCSAFCFSGTATSLKLDRRARNTAKATEYTAISFLRFQLCAAFRAVPEKLTGISRHDLGLLVTTFWTGDGGFQSGRLT